MSRKNKTPNKPDGQSSKTKKKYFYPPRRAMFSKTELKRAIKTTTDAGFPPASIDLYQDHFSLILDRKSTASGDVMATVNEQQLKELI